MTPPVHNEVALGPRSEVVPWPMVPRPSPSLLIIDADPGLQATLTVLLEEKAYVRGTSSLADAMERFALGTCSNIVLIADALLEDSFSRAAADRLFAALRCHAKCCLTVLLVDSLGRCERVAPLGTPALVAKPFTIDRLLRRLDDLRKMRGEPTLWRRRMNGHVGRGLAFLACNYGRAPSLDEISSAVCLSPSRLAHLFRAETGKSPKEYLSRMRVEVAKRALLESDDKLDSVAERLGFCDAPHFSRVFRRYVGLWPGDFRRAGLERRLARAA